ncbi:hypothetical protein [Segeticoccus rhizosphaerae]|uniref:hypothetical protein n=1 Tax=Segeticoccus rhizosphaerae TaxID=1104777 RepID=UPI0010C0087A|nr:hypothetical protein [Ornithinicoccus soli]
MPRSRQKEAMPWTWEIPAMVLLAVLLVLVLGVQLGRAAANLLAGAGWTWPARDDLFVSLPAVVRGDAGAGLHGVAETAGAQLLWWSVAVAETVLIAVTVWALVVCLRRWGPYRPQGMASRAEAEALLGRTRLRTVAPMVRPDLYGSRSKSTRSKA